MARTRKAPRSEQYAFSNVGLGCWIDGASGMGYTVKKMATDLLPTVVRRSSDDELVDAAEQLIDEYDDGLDPDEEQEWLDDATEVLQDATTPGLVWEWEAGDLCLLDEAEA